MRSCTCGGVGWRAFHSFVLLAVLGDVAMAQTATVPVLKAGDQWQFAVYYTVASAKPSRTWVIKSVTPSGIEATEDGEPLILTKDLNVLESPRHKESNPRALDFPLEVGKRWHYASDWLFKAKGSNGRIVVDVAVVGYEKVTVPAGEFQAFKLASRESLSGTSPIRSQYAGEITRTYWYAPAVRAVVKTVTHNPYNGPSTVELVAFDLKP